MGSVLMPISTVNSPLKESPSCNTFGQTPSAALLYTEGFCEDHYGAPPVHDIQPTHNPCAAKSPYRSQHDPGHLLRTRTRTRTRARNPDDTRSQHVFSCVVYLLWLLRDSPVWPHKAQKPHGIEVCASAKPSPIQCVSPRLLRKGDLNLEIGIQRHQTRGWREGT